MNTGDDDAGNAAFRRAIDAERREGETDEQVARRLTHEVAAQVAAQVAERLHLGAEVAADDALEPAEAAEATVTRPERRPLAEVVVEQIGEMRRLADWIAVQGGTRTPRRLREGARRLEEALAAELWRVTPEGGENRARAWERDTLARRLAAGPDGSDAA